MGSDAKQNETKRNSTNIPFSHITTPANNHPNRSSKPLPSDCWFWAGFCVCDCIGVELAAGAPQIPALAFSLASCPRAGPEVGVLVFLVPALADDQRDPEASPPAGLAAPGDLTDEAPEADLAACVEGACTDVK